MRVSLSDEWTSTILCFCLMTTQSPAEVITARSVLLEHSNTSAGGNARLVIVSSPPDLFCLCIVQSCAYPTTSPPLPLLVGQRAEIFAKSPLELLKRRLVKSGAARVSSAAPRAIARTIDVPSRNRAQGGDKRKLGSGFGGTPSVGAGMTARAVNPSLPFSLLVG